MKRTIYIAGPMTGIKGNNYPAFNQMAELLRSNGHRVLNPAEIKAPMPAHCRLLGKDGCWTWYMKKALIMMTQADTVIFLPNWGRSRGANIEMRLAMELGYYIYEECQLVEIGIVF
jgi:nucleoside 2-deoxyribosyltransferase